jgi:integrase
LCERVRHGELAPISDTTVRNHMLKISPFWKWAVRRDLTAKDWFSGALRERKKRRDKDERPPFTVDELAHTFPTFHTVRGDFRWFPVVALYSAMRAGEIAQLTVADVREIDGVPCFDVNERGDKTAKNANSTRIVPVHPVLSGWA